MSWFDEGTAMVAGSIMGTRKIVTKKIGEVVFDAPGMLGDVVEVWCKSRKEGRTSLTLDCRAVVRRDAENPLQICHANVVYVAIDDEGRPRAWGGSGGG